MDIRDVLDYEPATGLFRWSETRGGIVAGSIAGTITAKNYIHIFFMGRCYKAHRLAFLFMNGDMPSLEVDHIDGDGLNNAWSNLRECSRNQNQQNLPRFKSNTSGHTGVDKVGNKFRARIQVDGKRFCSELLDTIDNAANRYAEMKKELHQFNPRIRP